MNAELVESFFEETIKTFLFLEMQYGYKRLERVAEDLDDIRDAVVQVRYVGSRVSIAIVWSFAEGIIGVSFIENLQPGVYPVSSSPFPFEESTNRAKSISLYDLAEMLHRSQDPAFLLQKVDNFRTRKKRIKIIMNSMHEIIAGLAQATQMYATRILQGDTTIFAQVMRYYVEKFKRLYPYMQMPPGVIDGPS